MNWFTLFFLASALNGLSQNLLRFEVSGYGKPFDQTYTVPDAIWELHNVSADAAVFIYDRDIIYTIFSMNGVTTISASCDGTEGDPRPIFLTLPLTLSQGTRVRVVCRSQGSVLFMRDP
jgi:hypothetical protein